MCNASKICREELTKNEKEYNIIKRIIVEIYLIRHGECVKSSPKYYSIEKKSMNTPLTENGKNQAKKLGEKLKGIHFDKIYSSDLDRAMETSKIINSYINSLIISSKSFKEIYMGSLYLNKTWNDFPEIFEKWKLHKEDIPYPNGENGDNVWQRCKCELERINEIENNRIAIVCHGGTIRSIICGLLNISQEIRFFFGSPPEFCSISKIVKNDNQYFLHIFNDYNHIL